MVCDGLGLVFYLPTAEEKAEFCRVQLHVNVKIETPTISVIVTEGRFPVTDLVKVHLKSQK